MKFRFSEIALYGIRLSHIFEISSISNEKSSISIEILKVFRIRNFEILGFSHFEFEILRTSSEIPCISKTWNFYKIAGPLVVFIRSKCLNCN